MIIGGLGKDKIVGDDDDDILIAGVYVEAMNRAAADAIMSKWSRADLDYAARVDHLLSGGGVNGSFLLNDTTVFDDNYKDDLRGKKGRDWFLANEDDDKIDDELDEVLTLIALESVTLG